MSTLMPLVKKELTEDLVATRGAIFLVIAAAVLSAFSVLLIGNRELSLLDNAQAVYMMSGIIIALASLVAVIRGSDGFAGERERDTLEPLMLTPVTGANLAQAKMIGILSSWIILFGISIPYLWAVGSTGQNLWSAIQYLFMTGTLMILIFGGGALALSSKTKSFKSALSIGLTILLLAGTPVVFGPSLRQSAPGRVMDLVNPFANALNTLDSVIIDSQGLGFQALHLVVMVGYSLMIVVILRSVGRRIQL
jgi:ABC-type transport system involved in multi-copper enzyme maturation permease subunit